MSKPNIIFILIDDLGWKDLGYSGTTFYETPNIDALASHSMRFTDAYASCPVCSPTRASVMTGKYPATVGITNWIDWFGHSHPNQGRDGMGVVDVPYLKELPHREHTIASALNEGGYATWHVGKWHLGDEGHHPEDHGFDVNVGGCGVGSPGRGGYFSPWTISNLQEVDVPDGTYLTDYLTDELVKLVETHDKTQPFFLNLWYYTVHTPIQAKQEKIEKYEAKAKAMGLDKVQTFEEGDFFPAEHKKHLRIQRRLVQSDPVYAAMIESLDENIGKLVDVLERTGQLDNTIIFFTSDNGGLATSEGSPTCNAPLAEGKGWMYEGGTREPLFIHWPGVIAPESTCDVPITTPDYYPTMLEMAGLDPLPTQHVDGVSLVPILQGGDADSLDRDAIFWHYPHYGNQGGTPGSSMRSGDYKLIEFFEGKPDGNRVELYNLREDIGEDHDLAVEMPELAAAMRRRLEAWRTSVEAKIPQPNQA
ncbi:MAG: sulfatase [Chloroflexota bacterium]